MTSDAGTVFVYVPLDFLHECRIFARQSDQDIAATMNEFSDLSGLRIVVQHSRLATAHWFAAKSATIPLPLLSPIVFFDGNAKMPLYMPATGVQDNTLAILPVIFAVTFDFRIELLIPGFLALLETCFRCVSRHKCLRDNNTLFQMRAFHLSCGQVSTQPHCERLQTRSHGLRVTLRRKIRYATRISAVTTSAGFANFTATNLSCGVFPVFRPSPGPPRCR